ncbi:hypothetical protein ACVZHT_03500, partial [Vibrio diabolicus]
ASASCQWLCSFVAEQIDRILLFMADDICLSTANAFGENSGTVKGIKVTRNRFKVIKTLRCVTLA